MAEVTEAMALLGVEHVGHAITWRGSRLGWEGNDSVETRRLICSCGAHIEVTIRVDVGPPTGD